MSTSKTSTPDVKPPIHPRVKSATVGASAGAVVSGFIIWLIDQYVFTTGGVPDPVSLLILFFMPGIVAFVGGYLPKVR